METPATMIASIDAECNSLKESEQVLATVRERLGEVFRLLQLMAKNDGLAVHQQATRSYVAILQEFLKSLRKHAAEPLAARVHGIAAFNKQLEYVHERIDTVVNSLNVDKKSSVSTWRQTFAQAQKAQEQQLANILSNTAGESSSGKGQDGAPQTNHFTVQDVGKQKVLTMSQLTPPVFNPDEVAPAAKGRTMSDSRSSDSKLGRRRSSLERASAFIRKLSGSSKKSSEMYGANNTSEAPELSSTSLGGTKAASKPKSLAKKLFSS